MNENAKPHGRRIKSGKGELYIPDANLVRKVLRFLHYYARRVELAVQNFEIPSSRRNPRQRERVIRLPHEARLLEKVLYVFSDFLDDVEPVENAALTADVVDIVAAWLTRLDRELELGSVPRGAKESKWDYLRWSEEMTDELSELVVARYTEDGVTVYRDVVWRIVDDEMFDEPQDDTSDGSNVVRAASESEEESEDRARGVLSRNGPRDAAISLVSSFECAHFGTSRLRTEEGRRQARRDQSAAMTTQELATVAEWVDTESVDEDRATLLRYALVVLGYNTTDEAIDDLTNLDLDEYVNAQLKLAANQAR